MDTTEEFYTIRELARRWKLGRHSVHQLIVSEPGVIKVFAGPMKQNARYRVPTSVALKIEQDLFRVNQGPAAMNSLRTVLDYANKTLTFTKTNPKRAQEVAADVITDAPVRAADSPWER